MTEATRRISILLFALALAALIAPTASAEDVPQHRCEERGHEGCPHKGHHGKRRGSPHGPPLDRILDRHADRLGLDDAVSERVRAMAAESREEADAIHAKLEALHTELRATLDADEPDEDRVMDLAEEIGEVKTEGSKNRLSTMLRIRAELTPEQRQTLVEIREEFRGHHERRGYHHEGRDGYPRHHRRRGGPDESPSTEDGQSL